MTMSFRADLSAVASAPRACVALRRAALAKAEGEESRYHRIVILNERSEVKNLGSLPFIAHHL